MEDGQNIVHNDYVEAVDKTIDLGAFDTIEDTRPGTFVWRCAAAAAIGGMLFGYDRYGSSRHNSG